MKKIPLTIPDVGPEEEEAVLRVMRSGMLVQGKEVRAFEEAVAARVGRRHAVAVSSGTDALQLALQVLGISAGHEVIVPALTWPSPAHAAHCLGAKVRLVDVDPQEWNAGPQEFAAAKTGPTHAAVVIDQFGNPARGEQIKAALGDIPIVEDAACAIGSVFGDGRPCGTLGVISTFSFHPRKVLTTGEGGMCLTDDDALAERLRVLRNHGQAAPGVFAEPALNHRMSDMAAAMGLTQMKRLDALLKQRRAAATSIVKALDGQLEFQRCPPGATPNHQTLGALLPEGCDKTKFIAECATQGVQIGALSYDVSTIGTVASGPQPNAAEIVRRGVALPLYSRMGQAEVSRVVDAVSAAL